MAINNKALENFLDKNVDGKFTKNENDVPKVCDIYTGNCETIMPQKDGLIERVDKTYITKDGKMLLRD